jgi:predicted RNA-binding protein YlqC (UPF0109 family)
MTDTGDAAFDEYEDEVEYEEGDVNEMSASDVDDEYDDDEVDDEVGGDGNRTEDATSTAVLTYVAKALSTDPEAVVVQSERHRNGVRLRLHVAQEDMGRVIGRRGRTAQAIRTLVGVAGARDGVSASVDIVDD